jgi:hypothetical protein
MQDKDLLLKIKKVIKKKKKKNYIRAALVVLS